MHRDRQEDSSPPTFIFSKTHRGLAARLSPACRNTALCGITFSLFPFSNTFQLLQKQQKSFLSPIPFCSLSSLYFPLQPPLSSIFTFPLIVSSTFGCSLQAEGTITRSLATAQTETRTETDAASTFSCTQLSKHRQPLNTNDWKGYCSDRDAEYQQQTCCHSFLVCNFMLTKKY